MHQNGYDQDGSQQSSQQDSYQQNGYQQDGYQQNSYQQDGYGYQQNGYQQNSYQQNGYQQDGYGYQQNGYQQNGYQQGGYQQNGYQQGGYQQNGYQQGGYQQGYQQTRSFDPNVGGYQQPINVNINMPGGYQMNQRPAIQLPTNRSMWKIWLLSIVTFGIYGLVIMTKMVDNLNLIASRYDGKKTMHYCLLVFLIMPITFGIAGIVWYHKVSARMGNELVRRNQPYSFGASDFWLWGVLGSLIIVGPFIYLHKYCKTMNYLAADYNDRG